MGLTYYSKACNHQHGVAEYTKGLEDSRLRALFFGWDHIKVLHIEKPRLPFGHDLEEACIFQQGLRKQDICTGLHRVLYRAVSSTLIIWVQIHKPQVCVDLAAFSATFVNPYAPLTTLPRCLLCTAPTSYGALIHNLFAEQSAT